MTEDNNEGGYLLPSVFRVKRKGTVARIKRFLKIKSGWDYVPVADILKRMRTGRVIKYD